MRIALKGLFLPLLCLSPGTALADAAQVGGETTYHCYSFAVSNHTGKTITDLHFASNDVPPKPVPAKYLRTPEGWKADVEASGDLVFQTPGDVIPAPHTIGRPVEKPIAPGTSQGGYRFCLPAKTNLRYSISFSDHTVVAQSAFGGVTVGGTVVHNSSLSCLSVRLTAGDTAVSDAHFSGVGKTNPEFDSVTAPAGWSGGPTVGGAAVNLQASTALAAGQSADVELCFAHLPAGLAWKLTDAQHQDIPGANGRITPHK